MDYRLKKAYEQVYNKTTQEGWYVETLSKAYDEIEKLNEATIGPASLASLPGYYNKVNEFLKSNPVISFPVMVKKEEKMFTPDSNQEIEYSIRDPKAARNAILTGTIDGNPVTIKVGHIIKTPELKGKSYGNKGQIVEGVLGAALFARLKARPNKEITADDVYKVISEIVETQQSSETLRRLVTHTEEEGVRDTFELIVRLKAHPMQTFLDVETLKLIIPEGQMEGIVAYANHAAHHYATNFKENKKHDFVEVIADGVSLEATSKVDVRLKANGKELKHFVLSVKEGTTKIIGQKGSGGSKADRQKQYDILESFWGDFGLSMNTVKSTFLNSQSIETAYDVGYQQIAKQLSYDLQMSYLPTVQNLLKGILKYGSLDDPHLRLVQFTDKGYYVLDFKQAAKIIDDSTINLGATFSNKTRPSISVFDKNSNIPFLTFRMFRTSEGYIRNYVEKEELLTSLTKIDLTKDSVEDENNVDSPK